MGSVYKLINQVGQDWESAGEISPRHGHTCSHITTSAGEDEIIVVDGSNAVPFSVEIYTPQTGETRTGNDGWVKDKLLRLSTSSSLLCRE